MLKYCLYILIFSKCGFAKSRKKADPVQVTRAMKIFPSPSDELVNKNAKCDDGAHNLAVDFELDDINQIFNYLCLNPNGAYYIPEFNSSAWLKEYQIPPAYMPTVRCVEEEIIYGEEIPTFGLFRPVPPEYGTYKYLPPQRYLFRLAQGAIVMLYHPCAEPKQVKTLSQLVRGCMPQHLITPSTKLNETYPLALLSWGKILRLSVVDNNIVKDFIQQFSKQATLVDLADVEVTPYIYKEGLLEAAHLINDVNNGEACNVLNM